MADSVVKLSKIYFLVSTYRPTDLSPTVYMNTVRAIEIFYYFNSHHIENRFELIYNNIQLYGAKCTYSYYKSIILFTSTDCLNPYHNYELYHNKQEKNI